MSNETRTVRLAKAASALVALVVVLAGVPAALAVTVGWPLPRAVPHLGEIASALGGQSIDDSFLVKVLAVMCWLAWGQFSACVAAEVVGWRRGRGTPRIPLSGALQPLVAQLVMTAALLLQVVPRPSPGSPVVLRTAATAEIRDVAPLTGPIAGAEPTQATGLPSEKPLRTYTVKARDDLWTLAEKHLGDAGRWRELFELNKGRPQPKGGTLRSSWLIRPEWILQFPDDAVGLDADATSPSLAAAPASDGAIPITAAGGEAAPEPVPPPTAGEVCPLPFAQGSATAAAPRPSDPPATERREHDAPPSRGDRSTNTTQHADMHEPSGEVAAPSSGAAAPRSSKTPAGLLGAGLFAAGCLATLERMRRAQQRRRPRHRTIRMPDPAVVPAEVALRRAAAESPASRLDLALRLFARRAMDRSTPTLPAVSAVQVAPDGRVELLLTGPVDVRPAPFSVDADGQVWTLPASVPDSSLADAASDVGAPLPALASAGRLADTTVLVDLEAAGCTSLVGDQEYAALALRSMTLELATSLWADTVELILVTPDAFPGLERVRVVPTIAEVLDDVTATAGALNDALARVGAPTTLAARLGANAADGWIPTIVFCEHPTAEPEAFTDLVALAAGGGRGLAVVAVGDLAEAGRVVRLDDGTVVVTPPGVVLDAVGPTAPQLAAVEEILTVAADIDGVEVEDDAAQASATSVTARPPVDAPYREDVEILVRLLGPVEIEGAKEPVDRRRAVELIVYLATHPDGVDDERLKSALWPDEQAPQSSFNTTVTRARSRLGTGLDGAPHLPHLVATGGLYRLGPSVRTDFTVLERHLTAARHSTPDAATRTLKSGLEVVRGAPFAGVRQGYEWAYAEGFVARMEIVVAEAAHHLAQLALDARDADLAHWAASQGLLASPGDEVLYRDRMLAFDLAGNPAGVEAVMDELIAVAEALEPYDTLHPETIALYNRLSHRRRRTG